jgi:hypothetical protein
MEAGENIAALSGGKPVDLEKMTCPLCGKMNPSVVIAGDEASQE